ncbi:MAG: hypothetical protein JO321_12250 [Solirubrobacterales bacterium]|nr:hypothetical protein [Solirubrobacterales bacterium]MBV9536173.1 hypothetical protein [Solirubrobacterales bacterium]
MAVERREGAAAQAQTAVSVVRLEQLGELVPLGRPGGQGRACRPTRFPAALATAPIVVKLYHRQPSDAAIGALAAMIAWSQTLDQEQRAHLYGVAAWPLAIISGSQGPVGIAMYDVSGRFEVPFSMPSGRQHRVLLSLEHLLGRDDFLRLRGLPVRLDTTTRTQVAQQISGALAFLHRHGVVASDIAPNNLLIGFAGGEPSVCFIDCDSMVLHGRQALSPVETADWQIPAGFTERPQTRAADAYKLGLVVLRLYARSHDARELAPHVRHVPAELRGLVARSLSSAAANRPPAGEWQRALRQALVRGGLAERYPGPTPKPVAASRPVAPLQSSRYRAPEADTCHCWTQCPARSHATKPAQAALVRLAYRRRRRAHTAAFAPVRGGRSFTRRLRSFGPVRRRELERPVQYYVPLGPGAR